MEFLLAAVGHYLNCLSRLNPSLVYNYWDGVLFRSLFNVRIPVSSSPDITNPATFCNGFLHVERCTNVYFSSFPPLLLSLSGEKG